MMVASEAACETWQESHEKSEPDYSEVQRYPLYTEASNSVGLSLEPLIPQDQAEAGAHLKPLPGLASP